MLITAISKKKINSLSVHICTILTKQRKYKNYVFY